MGFFGDVVRGLNVFSSSKKPGIPVPKGAMRLDEYQKALSLHMSIKGLLKKKKLSEQRISAYSNVQLAKGERPGKIDEILAYPNMMPTYKRLRAKWFRTSHETQQKLIQATGTRPYWESDHSIPI